MAKKGAGTSELAIVLERLDALEARIRRLEGDAQAAIAMAGDFHSDAPAATEPPVAAVPVRGGLAPATLPPPVERGEVSEEILLVLSATVAAFLGERAHLRQARLVHTDAWQQQGRVSVMSSHRWAVHR